MIEERTAEFAKNQEYEGLLEEMNASVDGWGERPGAVPTRPVLFVVGAPRSGTTLLYQLLAATGEFAYPSNLIARFYRSPAWGERTQRLLAPLLERGAMDYTSRAGNTENWWGPHEFGYFWQRHFDFSSHHEPDGADLTALVQALAAFEAEAGRPMLFKNPILCFVLGQLAEALPGARFIWVRRPHIEVAGSVHRMRQRFHGDVRTWLSLRPKDAPTDAPVAQQIAHQLGRAQEALVRLRSRYGDRVIEVRYADVCADPEGAIGRALALVGIPWTGQSAPESFSPSDVPLDPSLSRAMEAALDERPELDSAEP